MPTHPLSRRSLIQLGGLSALAGSLSLSACGSSTTGGETGTVQFTSWIFGDEKTGPQLKAITQDFSKSSGTQVATNTYPYLQYLDQVVLKARSGAISGVAHIDEEWMSTLATAGALKALDSKVDSSKYPAPVTKGGTYRGVRYAMPWTQSAIGLVGNSHLLREAGASAKTTGSVEDFTATLRALKKADSSLVPYGPATSVKQLKDMVPWMWTFGSPIVNGDQVTLGDEGSLRALDYWKMMLDEGLIQAGLVRDDVRTLFAKGKIAIYDDAPQAIGIIPKQSDDPDIASKMIPLQRPGSSAAGDSLVWSQPLVAFDDGKSDVDFMHYLSSNDSALQKAFAMNGQPPATTAGQSAAWFAGNDFYKAWNQVVTPASATNPFWGFPSASAAQTRFNEQVEAALAGTSSSANAMKTARDDLQGMLSGK
ncbi:ABC transporter substrate-binding protein [Phycicoccus sp. MAQZ13P-2]|uniref:ABC transporter substrate-binding protein n=1 Tax=Phycicoccus mangrovi TaxID=2840470 RepID=UPI001C000A78|nr:ABC transporter substrate-binding protein [Phycicoccus mangrovi]MBT9273634.1 ABC transporter substrate-binding protein [Phycicoccus mangrovi]